MGFPRPGLGFFRIGIRRRSPGLEHPLDCWIGVPGLAQDWLQLPSVGSQKASKINEKSGLSLEKPLGVRCARTLEALWAGALGGSSEAVVASNRKDNFKQVLAVGRRWVPGYSKFEKSSTGLFCHALLPQKGCGLKTACGRRTATPPSFRTSACCGKHFLETFGETLHSVGRVRKPKVCRN